MRLLLAIAALAFAGSAQAGPWIDDKGRSTEMMFPGAVPLTIASARHSLSDAVQVFDRVCLKTAFDRAAVEQAVAASGWGLAYRAEMMPFKDPVDVGGWNAPDASLRFANGIFFNKKPQCSLTFAAQGPADMAQLQHLLTTQLGIAPANAAKQFDKKGMAKKYYSPEWSLPAADGSTLKIFALPSAYNSGAFQIAVLKDKAQ